MHGTFRCGPFRLLVAQVVIIPLRALVGIGGHHGTAAMTAPEDTFQRGDDSLPVAGIILRTVVFQDFPGPVPDLAGDNRLLFTLADGVFILDLADVGVVVQNAVNVVPPPELPLTGPEARRVQFSGDQFRSLNLNEPLEDAADNFCILL